MPVYFFSLTDTTYPEHSAEYFPNDATARAHAGEVTAELRRNSKEKIRVRVFNNRGERVDTAGENWRTQRVPCR